MVCKAWRESEDGVREFVESATEEEVREALYDVRHMARRYAGISRVTAERLKWIAGLVERLGADRFGPDFDVPF